MRARDIMTPHPLTLQPFTRIGEAITLMHDNDVRHVPVVRGAQHVGILSDRDLRALWHPGQDLRGDGRVYDRAVEDFMSTDPITVIAETDIDDVIDLLIEHRIGALPVIDADGDLIGIVSAIDVLQAAQGRF